jgi:adenylate cyclase
MRKLTKLGVAAVVALLCSILCSFAFVERIELAVSDQLLRILGKTSPPKNTIVIAIDEPSYRELGVGFDRPWPRALHAKLLRRLKELEVSSVSFDILFTGPSSDQAVDQELIDAFTGIPSIIGVEAIKKTIAKQGGGIVIEELDQPYDPFREVTEQALVNLDMNTSDGFIRTFPFATSDQTKRYPFLSYSAAGISEGDRPGLPRPRDLIRYYGSARQNARIVSYWEMFERMSAREEASFKDAIVFVGLLLRSDTGVAQKDSYLSPFGGDMIFGVEVHATIAGNLLQKNWISRPSRFLELAGQSLVAGAITFLALICSPITLSITTLCIVVAWLVTSLLALKTGFFLAGAVTILIILPLVVLVSAVVSYVFSKRSEEALRSAFSLYLSPDMVPKLNSGDGSLKLGGEKMWITAMFTDIADFTTISEEMPAEKTSEMLNAYFTDVMDVVFANEGTLLKFIGDAIFAIWGAPVKIQNHAEMATQTALAIQQGVDKFNASQRFPALITRIGIHTGPMLVGNLGSKRRFDYTAIGDSVNLASRIEGLNKYFGTTILLTESTRKDAGGIAGAVKIAPVRVKGRKEPVELFSLFSPPLENDTLDRWSTAVEQFSKRAFDESQASFQSIPAKEPRLKVACDLYAELCEKHKSSAPEPGWEGEIDFESK